MQIVRNAKTCLLNHKVVPTKAREKVLGIMMNSDLPLEVASVAAKVSSTIHLATIYRTLETLVKAGILARVDFQEGKFRYEYPRSHHHHAVCEACGKVEDFADTQTEIRAIENRVSGESGFLVTRHALELFGLCNTCQKKGHS